jgi:hypothetical protein
VELRCQRRPYVCKELDDSEQSVPYVFQNLEPDEVIALLEKFFTEAQGHYLKVEAIDISEGAQISLLIDTSTLTPEEYNCFHVIAQARKNTLAEPVVHFRYGIPPLCCYQSPAVAEFSNFIDTVVDLLHEESRKNDS